MLHFILMVALSALAAVAGMTMAIFVDAVRFAIIPVTRKEGLAAGLEAGAEYLEERRKELRDL